MLALGPERKQDARVKRSVKVTAAFLAGIVGILAAGSAATALVLRPAPAPARIVDDAVPVPELRVAGNPVPTNNDDVVGAALDLVRRYAQGDLKVRFPEGQILVVSRADFGLEIDRLRLAEFVKDARRAGSTIGRAHAASDHAKDPVEIPLPITLDAERAIAKLVDLKADFDKPAQDASMDLEKRTINKEVIGYEIDVYATVARIESAMRSGQTTVDAVSHKIVPKLVSAQLEGVEFGTVLGFFETRYNTAKQYAARTDNLRLAAQKLDGKVLMPGETFDFNAVVGPRDEAHGYKVAPVIAQGELVDGIGGGTCQVSGTLHGAAFFAGLEIVERYPHSRPSSYIKLGLDATVSYPNITYRIRNPFDYPIVLHEKVAGGVVRAEILGKERKLTVSYFRRIDQILPFEELERETDKLPAGERVVTQRGIPGFVATASRLVRDGAYGERTKWQEKYPPTTQIVSVGTGPEEMKPKLTQDRHAEYTVDEYIVMTQGPNVHSKEEASGGMAEARTPGKTGEAGWIKALGFEKTPLEEDGKDKDKDKDKEKSDKEKSDKPKPEKSSDKSKKKDEKKKEDNPKEKSKKKTKEGGKA